MPYRNDVNPAATGIVLGYKNPLYVADQVMPFVDVAEKFYTYDVDDLRDGLTVPDVEVGRLGSVNYIERSVGSNTGKCKDFGLGEKIPQEDIDTAAKKKRNAVGEASENLIEQMKLYHEVSVAAIVQNSVNYGETIATTDTLANITDFDVVALLKEAINSTLLPANVATIPLHIWSVLRSHPYVVAHVLNKQKDTFGQVSEEQFKDFFGLQKLIIPRAVKHNANKGQELSLQNIWGSQVAFHYQPQSFRSLKGQAWGCCPEFKKPWVRNYDDRKVGLEGGKVVEIGHIYNYQILNQRCGVLIEGLL